MHQHLLSTLALALCGMMLLAAAFATGSAPLEVFGLLAILPALVQLTRQDQTNPQKN